MSDALAPGIALRPARSRAKRAEDAASLCVSCKMCCDGTLFGFVPITDHEAEILRHRLPVVRDPESGEASFSQRCVALGVGGCGLYADRPVVCSSYKCSLLRRVNAGELDCDDGIDVVDRIRILVTRLDVLLPPGQSFWPRSRALRDAGEPEGDEERRVFAATIMDLNVLDRLLEREIDERLADGGEA